MRTWFAAVAAFITFGLALTACGSSAHPAPRSAGPTQDRPAIPPSAQQACQRLDPSAANVSASPPVPHAQFAQLVRFADCMRRHGEPTWPDPLPDGVFALPPPLMHKGDPVGEHADAACQKYLPSGHYSVIPASS